MIKEIAIRREIGFYLLLLKLKLLAGDVQTCFILQNNQQPLNGLAYEYFQAIRRDQHYH